MIVLCWTSKPKWAGFYLYCTPCEKTVMLCFRAQVHNNLVYSILVSTNISYLSPGSPGVLWAASSSSRGVSESYRSSSEHVVRGRVRRGRRARGAPSGGLHTLGHPSRPRLQYAARGVGSTFMIWVILYKSW